MRSHLEGVGAVAPDKSGCRRQTGNAQAQIAVLANGRRARYFKKTAWYFADRPEKSASLLTSINTVSEFSDVSIASSCAQWLLSMDSQTLIISCGLVDQVLVGQRDCP